MVLATLGTTTALAGFTLVFLGVVLARYEETVPGASRRVRARYTTPAAALVGAFLVSLAAIAVSLSWLVADAGHRLYIGVVVMFVVQLGATALASVYVAWDILWP